MYRITHHFHLVCHFNKFPSTGNLKNGNPLCVCVAFATHSSLFCLCHVSVAARALSVCGVTLHPTDGVSLVKVCWISGHAASIATESFQQKRTHFPLTFSLISLWSLCNVSNGGNKTPDKNTSAPVWPGSSSFWSGDEWCEAFTQTLGRGHRHNEWSTMKGGFQGNWATTPQPRSRCACLAAGETLLIYHSQLLSRRRHRATREKQPGMESTGKAKKKEGHFHCRLAVALVSSILLLLSCC